MSNDASFLDEQVDVIDHEGEQEESFNFEQHRDSAVEAYRRVRSRYENFANAVKEILVQVLRTKDIAVNSVEPRAKDPESFGTKASTPSEDVPGTPKYPKPLEDITDLAGVRIITFFPRTVEMVGACIR